MYAIANRSVLLVLLVSTLVGCRPAEGPRQPTEPLEAIVSVRAGGYWDDSPTPRAFVRLYRGGTPQFGDLLEIDSCERGTFYLPDNEGTPAFPETSVLGGTDPPDELELLVPGDVPLTFEPTTRDWYGVRLAHYSVPSDGSIWLDGSWLSAVDSSQLPPRVNVTSPQLPNFDGYLEVPAGQALTFTWTPGSSEDSVYFQPPTGYICRAVDDGEFQFSAEVMSGSGGGEFFVFRQARFEDASQSIPVHSVVINDYLFMTLFQ